MTLEWRYDVDDPAHPAFTTGYLVTVQEVTSGTQLGHVAREENFDCSTI